MGKWRLKKISQRLSLGILLIVCLYALTGCWDERDIEERTTVLAFGVDKAKEPGMIQVSIQVPIPLNISGGSSGGGGGGAPVRVFTAKARSINEAVGKLQNMVDEEIDFGQTRIAAFGEEAARVGLQNFVDASRRNPEVRRLQSLVVVKDGKAYDLLKVKTDLEKIPSIFLSNMIENSAKLQRLPRLTLGQFYKDLSNTSIQPKMISIKMEEKKPVVSGIAAFKGARLVGFIKQKDIANFEQISGDGRGGGTTIHITDGSGHLGSLTPLKSKSHYDYRLKNGKVIIDVDVNMEAKIKELTFQLDIRDKKNRDKIANRAERHLEQESQRIIKQLQQDGADIIGFGSRLRAYHHDIWKQVNWDQAFKEARIRVHYNIFIRRSGVGN
ncbi:Ger(x)C family germination protein [Scopulibacillus darangshiensis]|uniref:Ger(X)C family germination protein n=1 Tax=Scopulibacillus darangshiensis TaxID=442528 RepID=A0A4R2NM05_9BACL|nr:Ger(x)C family spore germination protein [Scopulibacillus darangshiensis]TCP22679.1 Ger(x)C family germination protein [Scopulibacillus darangshiensis]